MQFEAFDRLKTENKRLARRLKKTRDEMVALRQRLAELERGKNRVAKDLPRADSAKTARSPKDSHGGKYKYDYSEIIGNSSAMDQVFSTLDRIIDTNIPVLIQGESGTGKELVARAIHYNGPRRRKKFVSENCAAIPETLLESELFGYVRGAFTGAVRDKRGLFELAHGGTLFLDEIGEMSQPMQSKLLRVIQEGEIRLIGSKEPKIVDVRVLSASNKNLLAEVERSRFRKDLFYRINVITIDLPPLRERRDDIALLIECFLDKISEETGAPKKELTEDIMTMLTSYDWPGNVRELENEIYRLVALSEGQIMPDLLSSHIQKVSFEPEMPDLTAERLGKESLKRAVAKAELAVITEALRRCGGNQTKAAKLLGLSRFGLRKKMERCGFNKRYSPFMEKAKKLKQDSKKLPEVKSESERKQAPN
ncbi:MAG: sigma-54 interaction domain-containing protein [Planctomycetota bacterium]|jgi:transcriptional regulator with PAS, ATPase and Fis domain